ncbi:hypothetical protein VMCG_05081 [Cytospora schulzeri]|uniref:Uncharacterized protein n=1 Tax=Cytospora schulzeri TaxID=448051 RepID=A0A423WM82_9PEZI|nr:hypothetical protein VMCG_05081 [Valsa malicola]
MSSSESTIDTVAMHNAASSKVGAPGDDESVQVAAFCSFRNLPREIQDMIWEESHGQNNIYFIQIHRSTDGQDPEMSQRLRLDKQSTAAHWARIKLTCKRAKEALERAHRLAIAGGEQFQLVTTSTGFGETQFRVNVKDIVCFGFIQDDEDSSIASQASATDSPGIANSVLPSAPRSVSLPAQWSWIRRFAMPLDVKFCPNDTPSLAAGAHEHNFPVCYHCIAWNLSGLGSLEEVTFIFGGLPKPTDENPCGLLTKLSSDLDEGPVNCWIYFECPCDDFSPENEEEKPDDGEFEKDASLKVVNGSKRAYYQVRLSYVGGTREVHHSLRHFTHEFINCEEERESIYNRAPRDHSVYFKVLSYED